MTLVIGAACDRDEPPDEAAQCEQALGCLASCYALNFNDGSPSVEDCNTECGFYDLLFERGALEAPGSQLSSEQGVAQLSSYFQNENPYADAPDGTYAVATDVSRMMSFWQVCAEGRFR